MNEIDRKSAEESLAILHTLRASCSGLVEGHLSEDEQPAFFDGAAVLLGRVAGDFEKLMSLLH